VDAITWTSRTIPTFSSIFALTYGNNLYVYGAAGGDLATAQQYTYNTATDFALPACQSASSNLNPTVTVYAKNG